MPPSVGICTDCGLCCDGTLFSSVSLDAGSPTTGAYRLPVIETTHGSQLQQPCAALEGALCSIYAQRPKCCADYSCKLLDRVRAGRLDVEEAREIIAATRTMRARVVEAVGRTPWWTARRSMPAAQSEDALGPLRALERLVQRHFWGRHVRTLS